MDPFESRPETTCSNHPCDHRTESCVPIPLQRPALQPLEAPCVSSILFLHQMTHSSLLQWQSASGRLSCASPSKQPLVTPPTTTTPLRIHSTSTHQGQAADIRGGHYRSRSLTAVTPGHEADTVADTVSHALVRRGSAPAAVAAVAASEETMADSYQARSPPPGLEPLEAESCAASDRRYDHRRVAADASSAGVAAATAAAAAAGSGRGVESFRYGGAFSSLPPLSPPGDDAKLAPGVHMSAGRGGIGGAATLKQDPRRSRVRAYCLLKRPPIKCSCSRTTWGRPVRQRSPLSVDASLSCKVLRCSSGGHCQRRPRRDQNVAENTNRARRIPPLHNPRADFAAPFPRSLLSM